jgi:hypothetical protein
MTDNYITHKTGLSEQDELVVREQMLTLVRKDIMDFSKKNKEIVQKIEGIKRIPKVALLVTELEDVLMNLKIIKLDIDELMTDMFDTAYSKSLNVTELGLKKKSLKLLKFNMEMVEKYLVFFEKDLRAKLRMKMNILIGLVFILLGFGIFLWAKK